MFTPTPHYYIKLNDEGLPSIPSDQILLTTPNTTITFELNNGTPISHHIALISNIETPLPFGLIDDMLTASCPISRAQLQPFTFLPYDVSTSFCSKCTSPTQVLINSSSFTKHQMIHKNTSLDHSISLSNQQLQYQTR